MHYQAPLIDGDRVAMVSKAGTFTPCVPETDPLKYCRPSPRTCTGYETQTWSEVGYAWQAGALVETWTYDSAWKPPLGQEVAFQPVIAGGRVAIPEAEGAIAYVDAATGAVDHVVRPFGHDDSVYIVGALAEWHGVVFYDAVQFDASTPGVLADSWLVEIDTDGHAHKARYVDLVAGHPGELLRHVSRRRSDADGAIPAARWSGAHAAAAVPVWPADPGLQRGARDRRRRPVYVPARPTATSPTRT